MLQSKKTEESLERQLASWNPAIRANATKQLESQDDQIAFQLLAKDFLRRRKQISCYRSILSGVFLASALLQLIFWNHLPWRGAGRHISLLPFIMASGLLKYLARLRPVWLRLPKDLPVYFTPLLIDVVEAGWGNRELSTDETNAYDGILLATRNLISRIDEETARRLTPTQRAWLRREVGTATGLEDSPKSVAFLVGALLALAEGDGASLPDAVHLARAHVSAQVRAAASECARRLGSRDDLSFVLGQEATASTPNLAL